MDEDGFFHGELGGKRGLVPSNFLREIEPHETRHAFTPDNAKEYGNQQTMLYSFQFLIQFQI